MKSINIKFPLEDDTEKMKFFKTNSVTKDALVSDLLLLLLTQKGERYYNPNYGTNIIKYIFEPKDNLTSNDIEKEIKQTVKDYIPELTITKVTFYSDGVDNEGNPVGDKEIKLIVDFIYSEDTFSENGKVEIKF